ncbi:hypothetical protein F2Q68_00022424 [Brassica cretica]|uniref:Fungal lipase-type domain-containing protein n=1 Tax=Brassica cretica TaxID=69181 RepID=A0A8S9FZW9_BRACR|nr:hypothetical protein F2Q68_00022424 [Brassica cretica]
MGQRRWVFLLAIFAFLLPLSSGTGVLKLKSDDSRPLYNHTLTMTLVEYASAVYMSDLSELFNWTCKRCNGFTKGFEVIEIIFDVEHCLQAYVGVAKDLNAIIIAFRGTQEHSIQNWVSDLFWKQLDLNYPDMSDAMVHHGFYSAYHNTTVRPAVLGAVQRAKKSYGPNINIMVTGHSMGGAMATFCGLDLVVNGGEENVQVMTFGQPRVGNAAFASYYSLLVPKTFRITHDHDIVPHLPPYYNHFPQKTYHHFPTEVWLRDVSSLNHSVEKVCDNTGEDPTCSRSVKGNSISDHLRYFGVELHCETWRQCSIVMSHEMDRFSKKDSKGIVDSSLGQAKLASKGDSGVGERKKVSVMGSSISDHLTYFGVEMMCETWRQCSIVMGREVESYSRRDSKGNIFLSRIDPSPEVTETKTLSTTGVSSI